MEALQELLLSDMYHVVENVEIKYLPGATIVDSVYQFDDVHKTYDRFSQQGQQEK